MGIRYARALSGLALVASVVIAPAATAAPDASCTAILGGDWADENGTCSTTVGSVRAATMNMSAQLPRELLDHPTGPGPEVLSRPPHRGVAQDWRIDGAR
jgi:hypothetical protein